MDNLNLYQNTFAPNSSSSTNFYTQKNFHPRQESPISPNNDHNNNINQENLNNNNNEEMETVTSRQRTFKNNINEYSPSSNDGRRKNKMIHMIKNSLVQRVKNNVFLKEINNAYNEMGRFTTEGDLASAKMMENELNNLQSEVIMTNLYPVTKFGKSYFNENLYNSTNFSRSKYNTTSKKNKNNKGIYEIDKTTNSIRIRSGNNIINEENNIEEEENNMNQENNNEFDNNNNVNKDNLNNNNNTEINNIENNNMNNDNNMNDNEMEEEIDNKDNNENELSNSQNNNQTNQQKEPNPQKNNELNNIQNNNPMQIIIREKTIKENNINRNKKTIKDRNKNDFENNEDNNYNDFEESNVPYGYENGMYYDQDELEEVYEEYEFDENNRKIPKKSKIAQILEQTRNMVNDGTNPINDNQNYYSQIYPYNISPQNNNNIYPSTSPQINSWEQNNTNINPNPEDQNYQNSQTFNPSQNKNPENPNEQNKNYPYPNTLYQNQNNPQNSYSSYPQNSFQPDNQNPEYNPSPEKERNIPGPINKLNYPNYPENNNISKYPYNPQNNNLPLKNKPRSKSSKNIKPNQNYPNPYPYGYDLNNVEYPQRPILNFGESLASINNKFRTKPQMRKKSPANIPYSKGSKGKCFACDVECGIGVSGNSPNNYDPYMASLRKPRFDVTFYDAEKFGYYQYSSPNLIQENN